MIMKNFDIYCHRGEVFTLDFNVVNNNGSPYVLGKPNDYDAADKQRHFILISIASNRYEQSGRYVKNIWLDLSQFPKFKHTTILPVKDFGEFPPINPNTNAKYGAKGEWLSDEAVYYLDGVNGRVYKYHDGGSYKNYEFRIVFNFDYNITNEWVEQNYTYSIQLLSGELNADETKFEHLSNSIYLIKPAKLVVFSNVNNANIPDIEEENSITLTFEVDGGV